MPPHLTIRLQPLDGPEQVLGTGLARGVWPENARLEADQAGPSVASFDLKRNTGVPWPDLLAATPVDILVGGILRWSGRIKETPTRDGPASVINVQCQGWQAHLDDDQIEVGYVHARLNDWVDTRSLLDVNLADWAQEATAAAGNQLVVSWGKNAVIVQGKAAGFTLDLGRTVRAKRVVVEYEGINAQWDLYVRGHDTTTATNHFSTGGGSEDAVFVGTPAGAGTTAGTFATARRYVSVLAFHGGADHTATADSILRIKRVLVFTDVAYESGNASVLDAHEVVKDVRARALPLLSSDESRIADTSFDFPEFAPGQRRTPRELVEAANAPHDHLLQVDAQRRLVFQPRPTAPEVKVGAWSGAEFEDASANSLEDIYNQCVVEGRGSAGQRLEVARSTGQIDTARLIPITDPVIPNPSFDVNTTGWTPSVGTITRDTGVFDSSPASGRWDMASGAKTLTHALTGTFRAGFVYVLRLAVRVNSAVNFGWLQFGSASQIGGLSVTGDFAQLTFDDSTPDVFQVRTIIWVPRRDVSNAVFRIEVTSVDVTPILYIDTLALFRSSPTLVDRRTFLRTKSLPVDFTLTDALGIQLADTFLNGHKTTPLRGGLAARPGGVRPVLGGGTIPPDELLARTGQLLRLDHRIDPDTGGRGRDGVIADTVYQWPQDEATVQIDSDRGRFDALIERLALVIG